MAAVVQGRGPSHMTTGQVEHKKIDILSHRERELGALDRHGPHRKERAGGPPKHTDCRPAATV